MHSSMSARSAVCALSAVLLALGAPIEVAAACFHFAPNGNFHSDGSYLPRKVGFNLADVNSVGEINALPAGAKGLVWLGQCGGVDADFLKTVRPYLGNPNLFGFYLMDDPDPVGRHARACPADNLKAEADWVHANAPGAKTFILIMNEGSSKAPSFAGSYIPASSHVDLFGFAPYPCRTETGHCDVDMIDRYVAAAVAAGIPRPAIVPVYQAFGGGDWADDQGGRYLLPTVGQEQEMMARWRTLVPEAEFDYVYSWGTQHGDEALNSAVDLQRVFEQHNSTCQAGQGTGTAGASGSNVAPPPS